jgi:RNA polymerase sigma-70 factor (ECF subfamily)
MTDSASPVPPGFETTMLPHLDAAYNLARWLLHQQQDAEDAVQDAYLRAQRSFHTFRGSDGRPWLLTIVRNVCYSRLRQNRRATPAEEFDEDLHGTVVHPAERNAIDWREIRAAKLQAALESLTPEFREVIVLHEIEGLAYRDIAAVAEIPIGTVMSRLARARQKLEAALKTSAQQESPHEL